MLKSKDHAPLSSRGSTITKINSENEKIRKELRKVSIFSSLLNLCTQCICLTIES